MKQVGRFMSSTQPKRKRGTGRITQLNHRAEGKCERCGKKKPASATLCGACLDAHNRITADLKARNIEARLCAWCGGPNGSEFRTCDDCRAVYNARRRVT
jgi:hypothetical protein